MHRTRTIIRGTITNQEIVKKIREILSEAKAIWRVIDVKVWSPKPRCRYLSSCYIAKLGEGTYMILWRTYPIEEGPTIIHAEIIDSATARDAAQSARTFINECDFLQTLKNTCPERSEDFEKVETMVLNIVEELDNVYSEADLDRYFVRVSKEVAL